MVTMLSDNCLLCMKFHYVNREVVSTYMYPTTMALPSHGPPIAMPLLSLAIGFEFLSRCVDELNGFHCICPMYFSGPNCETDQNVCRTLQPCKNNGECVNMDIHTRTYRCICPFGYTGEWSRLL